MYLVKVGAMGTWSPKDYTASKESPQEAVEKPGRQKEKQEEMATKKGRKHQKEGKITSNSTGRSAEHPQGDPFRNCGFSTLGQLGPACTELRRKGWC